MEGQMGRGNPFCTFLTRRADKTIRQHKKERMEIEHLPAQGTEEPFYGNTPFGGALSSAMSEMGKMTRTCFRQNKKKLEQQQKK